MNKSISAPRRRVYAVQILGVLCLCALSFFIGLHANERRRPHVTTSDPSAQSADTRQALSATPAATSTKAVITLPPTARAAPSTPFLTASPNPDPPALEKWEKWRQPASADLARAIYGTPVTLAQNHTLPLSNVTCHAPKGQPTFASCVFHNLAWFGGGVYFIVDKEENTPDTLRLILNSGIRIGIDRFDNDWLSVYLSWCTCCAFRLRCHQILIIRVTRQPKRR
jgi:hypothetical protein